MMVSEGTVWQIGIPLKDMLSTAFRAFKNTYEMLLLNLLTYQSISRQVIVFSFCSDCFAGRRASTNPIEAIVFLLSIFSDW